MDLCNEVNLMCSISKKLTNSFIFVIGCNSLEHVPPIWFSKMGFNLQDVCILMGIKVSIKNGSEYNKFMQYILLEIFDT